MVRIINIIALLLAFLLVNGQNESNIWFFASDKMVDFNSGEPNVSQQVNNIRYYNEGHVVVSNSAGELLFYSEGGKIYDRNQTQMPNSSAIPIEDRSTSVQQAAAVKLAQNNLGNADKYNLFSLNDYLTEGELFSSIIDMKLRGNSGDVDIGLIKKLGSQYVELMAVVPGKCRGYWVIVHERNNQNFVAFEFWGTEIVSTVISKVGNAFVGHDGDNYLGNMLVTNENNLIYVDTKGNFEIFKFDTQSGRIFNGVTIYNNQNYLSAFHSAALSSDHKLLYLAGGSTVEPSIFQFDLSFIHEDSIRNSLFEIKLNHLTGSLLNGLIKAPDDKIYLISPRSKNYIGVINDPNQKGQFCDFDSIGIQFNSIIRSKAFPTPLVFEKSPIQEYLIIDNIECGKAELVVNLSESYDSIIWNTGAISEKLLVDSNGLYKSKLYKDGCIYEDSVALENISYPSNRVDTIYLCPLNKFNYKGEIYTAPYTIYDTLQSKSCDTLLELRLLVAEQIMQEERLAICDGEEYRAPDGTIYRPGEVYTTIKPSSTSCDTMVKTLITALPLPNPMIEGQRILCFGTKTNLLLDKDYDQYVWNTDDSTRMIEVGKGSFEVKVIDSLGCEGSAQVTVIERPEWLLELLKAEETEGNYLFRLDGDVARINEWTVNPSEDLFLLAGDRLAADGNTSPGLYRLEVKDEIGCISSVDFEIPEKVKSPATQQSNVLHPRSGNPDNRVWKARLPQNTTLDFAGIYDRWGNEIWSTQDPSIGWDGSIEGKEVDGGVYVFVIRYQLGTGGKEVQVGSVLLVK